MPPGVRLTRSRRGTLLSYVLHIVGMPGRRKECASHECFGGLILPHPDDDVPRIELRL
jgi:hypothetical protein